MRAADMIHQEFTILFPFLGKPFFYRLLFLAFLLLHVLKSSPNLRDKILKQRNGSGKKMGNSSLCSKFT